MNNNDLLVMHSTLKRNTLVEITNPVNSKSVKIKIWTNVLRQLFRHNSTTTRLDKNFPGTFFLLKNISTSNLEYLSSTC